MRSPANDSETKSLSHSAHLGLTPRPQRIHRRHSPDTQVRAQRKLFSEDHETRDVQQDEEQGARRASETAARQERPPD